ncbi:MAG: indole-3-glycerol phosphate synthase TrpC [Myxococcota bacterium]
MSVLDAIVARTRREVERRKRHGAPKTTPVDRRTAALAALRRTDELRVIAEVKFRSPSAGEIRSRRPGEAVRIANQYVDGGAAAVSVLADRASFGGGVLDVRRVANAVSAPVLFKGFVVDPCQVHLAASVGASLVLLLVRCLEQQQLQALVDATIELGLTPLVEAADEDEVTKALQTGAQCVGVNARDLHTFRVSPERAASCLAKIPEDRIAIYMSGIRSAADLRRVARGRADVALIGEGLMRASEPGRELAAWREEARKDAR